MMRPTVKCKKCGSGVLADVPPDDCNNCNPVIQQLFRDYLDYQERYGSEEERLLNSGLEID